MTTTEPSAKAGAGFSSADLALHDLGAALKSAGYAFTTLTPASHQRVNQRPGNAWATDLPGVFGWSRPFRSGLLPASLVELMAAADVLATEGDTHRSLVRFSSCDGDLFVHSAFPTTAQDSVFFGPDTYRMVAAAVAHLEAQDRPVRRAVDVGCGTGAGAIAVAKRAPEADVYAVDVNRTALRYTQVSAALAGVPNVRPVLSDLVSGVDGDFDLIVSNPPFMIDRAGRLYRDGGGPEGHALSLAIVDTAVERLAPAGSLVLFSGAGIVANHDPLRVAVAERLAGTDLDWAYREVDPDVYSEELDGEEYGDAERIAVVVLTATRPR
ncbi:methyltransferase [Cryptosporangium sp. NPDC051539]|uniref:methyltransferase n=1 Tax=Cryptosporangium sp. NPDC051539 TaxID=3363962 RepID=UPI0037AA649E